MLFLVVKMLLFLPLEQVYPFCFLQQCYMDVCCSVRISWHFPLCTTCAGGEQICNFSMSVEKMWGRVWECIQTAKETCTPSAAKLSLPSGNRDCCELWKSCFQTNVNVKKLGKNEVTVLLLWNCWFKLLIFELRRKQCVDFPAGLIPKDRL